MNILQVNFLDSRGGAAGAARSLHNVYPDLGHSAWMVVGHRLSDDNRIFHIDYNSITQKHKTGKLFGYLRAALRRIGGFELDPNPPRFQNLVSACKKMVGHEIYFNPNTKHILQVPPQIPDLIHAHNLHEKYFDLKYIPWLSRQLPFIVTLHDAWAFTGHCAHFIECQHWKAGCGQCPDLARPIALEKDGTRYNLEKKRRIYAKSALYVVTPSAWLMDQVEESILMEGCRLKRVIPNGIDLKVFYPDKKSKAREFLGLPQNSQIVLFVVSGAIKGNRWKDFDTIFEALKILDQTRKNKLELLFIGLGSEENLRETQGNLEIRLLPYEKNPSTMAEYYRAADVYLHAAHIDNYPTVILEALACGTPVIATDVGGISEQIIDGEVGYLVPKGDAALMAERTRQLISDPHLNRRFAKAAVLKANVRFGEQEMVDAYLDFYQQALSDWKSLDKNLQ